MTQDGTIWIAAEVTDHATRLWAVDTSGEVLKKSELPALEDAAVAAAASAFAKSDSDVLVTCGLVQDGHRSLPQKPLSENLSARAFGPFTRIGIAGLSQVSPAAVTRGAETRISGFLDLNPEFDGVLCLVDHETTWAHVSAGEVVSMRVFSTCLLAEKLTPKSAAGLPDELDEAFDDALSDTLSKPERLAGRLSSAKADAVLQDLDASDIQQRLWGALLGAELAATRPYWLGQQVAVIADAKRAKLYVEAMRKQGLAPIHADGETMLLRGFSLAWGRCKS